MAENSKQKLTITSYPSLEDAENGRNSKGFFQVMFNPVGYQRKVEVSYFDDQATGETKNSAVFHAIKPQDFTFEFMLDGTGVSGEAVKAKYEGNALNNPGANSGGGAPLPTVFAAPPEDAIAPGYVEQCIRYFMLVSAEFQTEEKRPPVCTVSWGTLYVITILKTADINYTLFDEDGNPLRATISATFTENTSKKKETDSKATNSPDLTHERRVKEGQSLTMLSKEIYGDPKYYMDIARANGLSNLRNLKTGMRLIFPPLDFQK